VAESLPFKSDTFDFVHSHHVFEHVRNPFLAADEVYRVLKNGGRIFIEVPNQFDNIQFFRDRIFGRIPVRERNIRSIHHLYFFSEKNLRKLFVDAGFVNVHVTSYYLKPRTGWGMWLSFTMRLLGRIYLGGPFVQITGTKPE
jgi:SAM-dependent methyltransferase